MTARFAGLVRSGAHRRMGGALFTTPPMLSACSLMPFTAAAVPRFGMLPMLTVTLSAGNARPALAWARVRELSERDERTGLQNRRRVLARRAEKRVRCARGGPAVAEALLGVDHFKRVNDRRGHRMGDAVLRTYARAMAGNLRSTDRIARHGGEEFLLLLPNTADAQALVPAAQRFRGAAAAHGWCDLAQDVAVTCSISLTARRAVENVSERLERADAAQYRAKSEGRNTVLTG